MKYFITGSILSCVLLLVWCTQQETPIPTNQQHTIPSRESSRVVLSVYTDTPFTEESPTRQIWFGWVWKENLIRTAKHLVDSSVSRVVITNDDWIVCPLQNIWLHPFEDIALIKTSRPCVSWLPSQALSTRSLPKELIYINGVIHKSPVISVSPKSLLGVVLTPGMSGSPLFLDDHTLVGIITAQSWTWTEFVQITSSLLASWPDVQKVILQ